MIWTRLSCAVIITLTFAFCNFLPIFSNELTRCCAGGARHYRERENCTAIKVEGDSQTCARAALICCTHSLLDASCTFGSSFAVRRFECSFDVYLLGGATKKECCDCCMLAYKLVEDGLPCLAGSGFSSNCLNSFNKCCKSAAVNSTISTLMNDIFAASTQFPSESISANVNIGDDFDANTGVSDTLFQSVDSILCTTTKCDHFCNVRTDNTTECSCRHGFDLDANGQSCIDIDECLSFGYALCLDPNTQCLNMEGSFSCVCRNGFYWSNTASVCVDIDECLLLVDDCLESQRCLNTPGSYKCIRTLSCGTGYALDSKTEQCVDVNECTLGSHNCGSQYQCRNTQGSYRCYPRKCLPDEFMNLTTGECDSVNCPPGYAPIQNKCEDINECQMPNRCNFFDECINIPGSFRCQEKSNLCTSGFRLDRETGFCLDKNECEDGTHTCRLQQCINLPGTFKCRCSAGFEFNETTKICEDVNECEKFAGHTCSLQAVCENTIGSFFCHCKAGFKLAEDGRNCDDVNECEIGLAKCQQKCVNTPGSYQCICDRGYQLGIDKITCEDINECAIWIKSGKELCMGDCINTMGSFACTCPGGYEMLSDEVTCKDIDECSRVPNICPGNNEICVNTLGSFKCQSIKCPKNYFHDVNFKNRCIQKPHLCTGPLAVIEHCRKLPLHISWQHISIPKHVSISIQRTSVTLFSMKGPNNENATMQFELRLVSTFAEMPNVTLAVRENFLLQKGEHHNSAVIALRNSLDGPQEVHLELILRLSTNSRFIGKYVANLIIYVSQYHPQQHYNISHNRKRREFGHMN